MRTWLQLLSAVVFVAITVTQTQAGTLAVPSGFPTIQAAIDAAVNGDEVIVGPGTYSEQLDFLGLDIVVRSSAGPAATILDAGGFGTVVSFVSGETAASVLDGFTVTGGGNVATGGGIRCVNSSPTIVDCEVRLNSAFSLGGGVYCEGSSATFDRCLIFGNQVLGRGGGLYSSMSSIRIRDSNVQFNSASTDGGGVAHDSCGLDTEILRTVFDSNSTALFDGAGVLILNSLQLPLIENCIFVNNQAGRSGGGIACSNGGAICFSTTFTSNTAATSGGAVFATQASVAINYSILWADTAPMGSELATVNASLDIVANDVAGGLAGVLQLGLSSIVWSDNIDVDPLLSSDFRLTGGSPCIDATTFVGTSGGTDFHGQSRFLDGDNDGTAQQDMGADEYNPVYLRGDGNQDGAVTLADAIAVLQFLFVTPGGLECVDAADANDSGSVESGDYVTILNALFTPGATLPSPFPTCGFDPTPDALYCDGECP